MKKLAGLLTIASSLTACVDPDPDPAADLWPCESTRGDVRTVYEYDDLHHVTFWEHFEAGVSRGHQRSRYAGDTLVHLEFASDEFIGYRLDRTLMGDRVVTETVDMEREDRFDYRETWTYEIYEGDELTTRDRTWGDGHTSMILIRRPDPATEITWEFNDSRCTKRTTTRGDGWMNEIEDAGCDFSPETQWNHVLDATGRPLRKETWQLPETIGGEPRLIRRVDTKRLDNGAPVRERDDVFGDGSNVVETVYRFTCD